ncbi:hypothetical protein NEOLEDRAFT_1134320 [Neolentinus lepideus HHB14362 ss-1]|uniref:Uncharacterized protein n=1 Tax=Neolentinus lepideus HHB14362 ss-1 TaxID=1314782 RepID=A0A165SFP5_9AGAM|nr:hypothetical protein NEOLEDRAFT_1134320 [Neolentinus lepideus HHB14362 ss-1]
MTGVVMHCNNKLMRNSACNMRCISHKPGEILPVFSRLYNIVRSRTLTTKIDRDASDETGTAWQSRTISTLLPHRLSSGDFLDLSGKKPFRYDGGSVLTFARTRDGDFTPWPSGSRGFLYWHVDAGAPLVTSEIRFKVVQDGKPSSFKEGQDILNRDGVPWRVSIVSIASNKRYYRSLRSILFSDGIMPEDFIDKLAQSPVAKNRSLPFVWSLKQPFLVKLARPHSKAWVVNHQLDAAMLNLSAVFGSRIGYGNHFPYRGCALVQFEPSPLKEHQGTRAVVLRLIKFTRPLERTDDVVGLELVPEPREGELVMRLRKKHGVFTRVPWSYARQDLEGGIAKDNVLGLGSILWHTGN